MPACSHCPCHGSSQAAASTWALPAQGAPQVIKPRAFVRWQPAASPSSHQQAGAAAAPAAAAGRPSTACRATPGPASSSSSSRDGGQGSPSTNPRDTSASSTGSNAGAASSSLSTFPSGDFCIIESRETVKDFATMQLTLEDITNNIIARQSRIFLLMEEVRRLRIQQRLKGVEVSKSEELANEKYVSALPLLPPLTSRTLNNYYSFYACFVGTVIVFGGILAPILELKLGLGGTSYLDFVESLHLPRQFAQVDPIVASFCGGSVGVLSALLVVEVNNVKKQQRNRCHYCEGTGYLSCGACVGTGRDEGAQCGCCAGSGKVMCTSCLCTGKQMATEHDPRIDPFNA